MTINQSRISTAGDENFQSNFDRIFGTKEERKAKREKEKAEAAEKQEKMQQAVKTAYISGSFEAFKSPIDGSIISDPSKLREHNRRHKVADIREYDEEHFRRRSNEMYLEKTGQTAQATRERKKLIYEVLKHHKIIK